MVPPTCSPYPSSQWLCWQTEIWPFFSHRYITAIVSWLENNGSYVIKLKNTLKDGQNSVCQARPVTGWGGGGVPAQGEVDPWGVAPPRGCT